MSERAIIDRSILIDCLRARPAAVAFLRAASMNARPRTHLLVAAELLAGARDKDELAVIDSFVSSFEVALSTEVDGLTALDLYKRYRLSHGVDWPDCQIAATALRLNVAVTTQNTKHFLAFAGLRVERAY